MFHHKEQSSSNQSSEIKKEVNFKSSPPPIAVVPKEFTLNQVGELLEKNLKWSQIIYEQNRKINRKMLWSSMVSWLYFIIIVAPIVLAVIFLPPIVKDTYDQYRSILGKSGSVTDKEYTSATLNQIINLLPLDAAKEAQVKALLK
ncbi:MAG: hypothetical protein WCX97_02915 [Candidatus Magasanikbacteria bacterium]